MKGRLALLAAVVAAAGALVPANADPSDPPNCNSLDGSAGSPHLVDALNDYGGFAFGNGGGVYGDVNREGNDLVAGWLNYDASQPTAQRWTANIMVQNLSGLEVNAIWYFLWTYDTGNLVTARRWVSAEVQRPVGGLASPTTPIYAYDYGHFDPTGPIGSLVTEGGTTGSVTLGANGVIKIHVPMNRMGNPVAGDLLGEVAAESRFLVGTPQTGGLVGVTDDILSFPCIDVEVL